MVKSIKSLLQCHECHIVLLDTIKSVTGVSALHTVLKLPCNTKKAELMHVFANSLKWVLPLSLLTGSKRFLFKPLLGVTEGKTLIGKKRRVKIRTPWTMHLLCHRLSGWLSCMSHWMLMIWDFIVLLLMGAPLYCREVNIRWGVKGKAEIIR